MDALATGNAGWADWLFLIAAVVFFAAGILALMGAPPVPEGTRTDLSRGSFVAFGLALVAIAFLVL